jgi:site-specific recombinase XerD
MRFIIDYWPRGRHGGRRQITLPAEIRTRETASKMERDFHQARRPGIIEKTSRSSTIADLFPDYLSWYRLHRATTTWRDVSRAWEHDLKRIFGDTVVTTISDAHFSLYQKLRSATVSNRTVNKELNYLSGFLRWCRREKKLDMEKIEYEALPYKRPLPIVLSPDEVVRILAAAEQEPVYHVLIMCLYTLGLRISEAKGITVDDFDFGNRSVRVKQKGGSWKILPINDQVIEAVGKLIKQIKKRPKDAKKPEGPCYVFSVRKSGKPFNNIRKALARICKRAEVTKKVTPHLFRHSIATHLMGADVNLRTIQQYLGHTQIATTEFYTHVALGHLRSAQNKIGLYGKNE